MCCVANVAVMCLKMLIDYLSISFSVIVCVCCVEECGKPVREPRHGWLVNPVFGLDPA